MKIMEEKLTVQKFVEMVNENELSLEHPLQREAGRWNGQKRQGFIESIINGLYIPAFFIVEKNGSYLLDGLQRYTTIADVINDTFTFIDDIKLHKNGMIYNIVGKKFSEIDKKLQDKILQFNFTFAHVTDATSKEIELMFYNLNNSEQMSESEKAKSIIGIDSAKWLNTCIKNDFFTNKIHLTVGQRKNTDEQTVIFQYTYLTKSDNIDGISQADTMSYLRENRDIFTKELKTEITSICEFISKALPDNNDKYKKLTKTHLPMLMLTAKEAIESNVNYSLFGEWIIQFFKDYATSSYKNKGCGAGNVKKEKTLIRIEEMKKHYLNYIFLNSEIKEEIVPEPKEEPITKITEIITEVKQEIKPITRKIELLENDNWEDGYSNTNIPSSIQDAYNSTMVI